MKTLTRIKLIHWHMFDHQTFSLKGNTLVTGQNSAGKSTLLDAIQYVLTGGKTRFNVAAHAQTKRTLESYVRGKTGFEGQTYLRSGSVTAHIALELTDSHNNKQSVIGVVIDLSPEDTKKETFYHMKGSGFLEDDFFDGDAIRRGTDFISHVRSRTNIHQHKTKKEAQQGVLSVFGLQPSKKYFDLLAKALAFKPIDDVGQFVYDFLLNEEAIEIDALRENIRRFQEIEKLIDREEIKQDALQTIIKEYDTLEKQQRFEQMYAYVRQILEEARAQKRLTDNEEARLKTERSIAAYNQNIQNLKQEMDQLQEEISTTEAALKTNEAYTLLEKKRRDLDLYEQEATELKKTVTLCVSMLKTEKRRFQKVGGDTRTNLDFDTALSQPSTKAFEQVLEPLEALYRTMTNNLNKEEALLNQTIEQTEATLLEVTERLERLKARQFTYPPAVTKLHKRLTEDFKARTGRPPKFLKPLCELLEIDADDEPYRDLIEGLLGPWRFTLIADSEDLTLLKSLYANIKDKKPYAGAMLADLNLAASEHPASPLAERLKTESSTAQALINQMLLDFDVVENSQAVIQSKRRATLDTFMHDGQQLGLIDETFSKQPFIGQGALAIQIKHNEARQETLRNTLKTDRVTRDSVRAKLKHLDKTHVAELLARLDRLDQYTDRTKRIHALKADISTLEKDPSWVVLDEQLNTMKKRRLTLQTKHDNAVDERGGQKEALKQLNNRHGQLEREAKEKAGLLQAAQQEASTVFAQAKNTYEKYIQEKVAPEAIAERAARNQNDYRLQAEKEKAKLIESMIYFNSNFHGNLPVEVTSIDDYRSLLHDVESRQLTKYREQSRVAREQCERAFKEDFISKLKQHIDHAYEEINRLNRALRHKQFGRDTYTFSIGKSKNNEFGKYHDIIRSGQEFEPNTLLSENISDENRQIMNDLFDVLTAQADADVQEKELQRYTDYRAYMSYDIIITDSEQNRTRFSAVAKEKSGGETQTPFYVIIAASFEQLINPRRKGMSGCLVLFDEAFNNMDENRIEAMMTFYNELNIQLIIAVPPARMINIINHVETTLAVVRDGHQAHVNTFHTPKEGENA